MVEMLWSITFNAGDGCLGYLLPVTTDVPHPHSRTVVDRFPQLHEKELSLATLDYLL